MSVMSIDIHFPWNDLISEMQNEVVTHLDPYVKQSLSMTCKANYNRWKNPQYYAKSREYLARYARLKHIKYYLKHPLLWTCSDAWCEMIRYGVENVFSPIDFLEMTVSSWKDLPYGVPMRIVNEIAESICQRGTLALYEWFILQKTQHGWSTPSKPIIDERIFQHRLNVDRDLEYNAIFTQRFDVACAVLAGNVDLVDALIARSIIPLLSGFEFLCCVLLSDAQYWRNPSIVLRIHKKLCILAFGDTIYSVLMCFAAPGDWRVDLGRSELVFHLFDLWPVLHIDTRRGIIEHYYISIHLIGCAITISKPHALATLETMGWDLKSLQLNAAFEDIVKTLQGVPNPQAYLWLINRGALRITFRDADNIEESIFELCTQRVLQSPADELDLVRNWLTRHAFSTSKSIIAAIDKVKQRLVKQ